MTKNKVVPMSDWRVETESSLGTGMKLKISTLRKQRKTMLGCCSLMKDSESYVFFAMRFNKIEMPIFIRILEMEMILENNKNIN
mgnify:CR=1 FL=1